MSTCMMCGNTRTMYAWSSDRKCLFSGKTQMEVMQEEIYIKL